jgi:hypothetical protein
MSGTTRRRVSRKTNPMSTKISTRVMLGAANCSAKGSAATAGRSKGREPPAIQSTKRYPINQSATVAWTPRCLMMARKPTLQDAVAADYRVESLPALIRLALPDRVQKSRDGRRSRNTRVPTHAASYNPPIARGPLRRVYDQYTEVIGKCVWSPGSRHGSAGHVAIRSSVVPSWDGVPGVDPAKPADRLLFCA